jgi:hypothetical protein
VEVVAWNLLSYSEEFTNAYWIKPQTSLVSGQTAPNGTASAYKLVEDTSTDYHWLLQNSTLTSGGIWVVSIYAKAGGRNYTVIGNASAGEYAYFNLQNGTIVSNHPNAVPTIEAVGNGFYRCVVKLTTATSAAIGVFISPDGSNIVYTGNGTSGIFIWGAQLNIGSTAKPYFPTTDRLNVPRLTYQNGGGGCPSLLLEKQSTNLALYSEQFDDAWWLKFNATISANATTSPDGTQNADKLIATTDNSGHAAYKQTLIASGSATISIFAKAGGYNFLRIGNTLSLDKTAYFNLSNGTLGTVGANATASILNMGNGWYQCVVTFTATSGSGIGIDLASANDTPSFIGDGTSGVFIYGAQLEASSYFTSYIPTTSASATRVADECSKTGISSLIGQQQGTLFFDFNPSEFLQPSYVGINGVERFILGFEGDSGSTATLRTYGIWNTSLGIFSRYQRLKVAMAYKNNDLAIYINGTLVTSSSAITFTGDFSVFSFANNVGSQLFNGNINQAALFKTRLTNAELASLTTL